VDGGYTHEMVSPAENQELIEACLGAWPMIVLSGYQSELYKPLEAACWSRIDNVVPAYTSDTRACRTECLWINPQAQAALAKQRPQQAVVGNGDLFCDDFANEPEPFTTISSVISRTEAMVLEQIRIMKQAGQKVRI
jgi:hypothetical protein